MAKILVVLCLLLRALLGSVWLQGWDRMGWDEPTFRGVWLRGEWDGLVPGEKYSSQIRDEVVRQNQPDQSIPLRPSERRQLPLPPARLRRGAATAACPSSSACSLPRRTPSPDAASSPGAASSLPRSPFAKSPAAPPARRLAGHASRS
uniref:Uncharacterized protein n=1 Tax=Oryza sativa subsp. japonica TaxID=39947 RepID=Q9SNL8_ORYSJ|nr:hypothetical protein [Oryza sativa Japonica Group]BAB19373.1 hypothetical protein [Oryza sativa Japonica Group]